MGGKATEGEMQWAINHRGERAVGLKLSWAKAGWVITLTVARVWWAVNVVGDRSSFGDVTMNSHFPQKYRASLQIKGLQFVAPAILTTPFTVSAYFCQLITEATPAF